MIVYLAIFDSLSKVWRNEKTTGAIEQKFGIQIVSITSSNIGEFYTKNPNRLGMAVILLLCRRYTRTV